MSSIQLTVANNTLNISINIAELLNKGSINISLNNQLNQLNPEIPVAELVSDNTNVTIRRKTRKIKERVKKMLIIEEDDEVELEKEVEKETEVEKEKEVEEVVKEV